MENNSKTKRNAKGLPAAALLPGGAAAELAKLNAQIAYIDIQLAHIAAAKKAAR